MQVKHFVVQELFSWIATASCSKFRIEVEFSKLFEQIRHFSYNQSESRYSQAVPGLLINSAGNEIEVPG